MPSSVRQLHRTTCRLLGLTLVLWLSVSARSGCLVNCGTTPSARDPEALRYLHPIASQSSATITISGLSPCHQSNLKSGILAPALSCPTHAQLTGAMPCCSRAPAAAHSQQNAPGRVVTVQGGAPLRGVPHEIVAVHALALHANHAERQEIYLRHCVLLI